MCPEHLAPPSIPERHARTTSFLPRRRRLSPSRQALVERLAPAWTTSVTGPPLDFAELFGVGQIANASAVILEIGYGFGDATLALARARPNELVLGVDVHTPGLGRVLEVLHAEGLDNVRLVDGDLMVLLDRIGHGSLDGIRVFFPDPWPKMKQRHRRLIRAGVVELLVDRLRPGGALHLATDIEDYARQIEQTCDAELRLAGGRIPRPDWRPETSFERKGVAAGRTPVDLLYTRTAETSSTT